VQNTKKGSKPIKNTIFNVAKSAGVAASTVSRVINNKGDVSEETRRKVLKAMKDLNYTPNIAARVLGGGMEQEVRTKSLSVGLIVQENLQEDPYFIHIMRGAERKLSQEGYNCIFSQIPDGWNDTSMNIEKPIPRILVDGSVDGMIAVGIDNEYLSRIIKDIKLPSVFVDCSDFGGEFDYIKADNYEGAKKAVSYLIELGHRRIAIIVGQSKDWFFSELEHGYRDAHRSKNLTFDPILIVTGENNSDYGYTMARKLIELPDPPSAIFTNDITAIGVIKAVKETGMRIPEDISIIGFDDIDAASYIDPPLTTVKVMKTMMGELAAKKLVQLISEPGSFIPSKTLLPVEMVVRQSAAKPNNNTR
jgi:LacI family transcriptional regulator